MHYTAGRIAGAIIGSITAAIVLLLCVYNGRNKRAMARDMAAFFGVNVDGTSIVPQKLDGKIQQDFEEVYNPMI